MSGPALLERAGKLFAFDERAHDSNLVRTIWRTRSVSAPAFISVAVPYGEIVLTRQQGETTLTVRGPETRASTAEIPRDASFFGMQCALGAFMPHLAPHQLVAGAINLPARFASPVLCGPVAPHAITPPFRRADTGVDRPRRPIVNLPFVPHHTTRTTCES